jgi:hypothetical protein
MICEHCLTYVYNLSHLLSLHLIFQHRPQKNHRFLIETPLILAMYTHSASEDEPWHLSSPPSFWSKYSSFRRLRQNQKQIQLVLRCGQ